MRKSKITPREKFWAEVAGASITGGIFLASAILSGANPIWFFVIAVFWLLVLIGLDKPGRQGFTR